jgi:hypothetical protein
MIIISTTRLLSITYIRIKTPHQYNYICTIQYKDILNICDLNLILKMDVVRHRSIMNAISLFRNEIKVKVQ